MTPMLQVSPLSPERARQSLLSGTRRVAPPDGTGARSMFGAKGSDSPWGRVERTTSVCPPTVTSTSTGSREMSAGQ